MAVPVHPYFPLDLHLPGYVPLQVDFVYILGIFTIAVLAVFGLTWKLSSESCCRRRPPPFTRLRSPANRPPAPGWPVEHFSGLSAPLKHHANNLPRAGRHKQLTTQERVLAGWFKVTGAIHLVIEGWVVAKADFFQDASGNYLSDTCEPRRQRSGAPHACSACHLLNAHGGLTIVPQGLDSAAGVPDPSLPVYCRRHYPTPLFTPPPLYPWPLLRREGVQQGRQPLRQPRLLHHLNGSHHRLPVGPPVPPAGLGHLHRPPLALHADGGGVGGADLWRRALLRHLLPGG